MKDLADFSVTPGTCTSSFWLHADHSISILHSCDNDFVIINHCSRNAVYFFPWRVSPAFNHSLPYFRTQGVEKFLVFFFFHKSEGSTVLHDLVNWSPPELRNCFFLKNGLNKGFSIFRGIDGIACFLHSVQYSCQAFERIKICSIAYRTFNTCAGSVVQDESDFSLVDRFFPEFCPFQNSECKF